MYEKVKTLLNFAGSIAKEKEPEKLIPMLADLAKSMLDVDRCSLFVYDEQSKKLYTIVAHGGVRIEVDADKGIVGESFRTGEALIVNDAYAHPKFNKEVDLSTGYRTRNILASPLIDSKGKVLGVFQAINKLNGDFNNEDVEFLTLLSVYASDSLEASMLYKKLREAYEETITRLSYAAEYKDPETYNHIIRIGLISSFIAERLGFDQDYCYSLKLAAPMHDIGKIGIPDNILLKKGKLEGEEWEIMKRHTIIGYEILKDSSSELLQMASRIALEHHEKYDGTGYPYGKKGEDICPEARITAIADIFDALTSERPYKPAWSVEETLKYMKSIAGSHIDPHIFNVLLENIDEILNIKEKYKD